MIRAAQAPPTDDQQKRHFGLPEDHHSGVGRKGHDRLAFETDLLVGRHFGGPERRCHLPSGQHQKQKQR